MMFNCFKLFEYLIAIEIVCSKDKIYRFNNCCRLLKVVFHLSRNWTKEGNAL